MTPRLCERIYVGVRAYESSIFGTDYFLWGQFLYAYRTQIYSILEPAIVWQGQRSQEMNVLLWWIISRRARDLGKTSKFQNFRSLWAPKRNL
eukprot:scaffold277866_cov51-Attheya_sp.AAC.3